MNYIFWILLATIIYSYLGYPIILSLIVFLKKLFTKKKSTNQTFEPNVTLFIAAYNEESFIENKIQNTLTLNYPKNKIEYIWITDGSTDKTPDILKQHPNFTVLHEKKRNGKTGAINRGMDYVKNPLVIFSDANTTLNPNAIKELVKHFKEPTVGCVAGEKRILPKEKDNAVNSGEGIYWRYESYLKNVESDFYSAIGAAGELFAIRTELFEKIEPDTILDDFIISLRIAQKGYKIKYTPLAYALERASASIQEELKRKKRIAYGGFQSITRLKKILNPFKCPILFFQYISHKIFRWTLIPLSIFLLPLLNIYLVYTNPSQEIYLALLGFQITFYLFIFLGYILQSKKVKLKLLFTPYYIFIMNLSEIMGFFRFIRNKQSVNWEKAKRA